MLLPIVRPRHNSITHHADDPSLAAKAKDSAQALDKYIGKVGGGGQEGNFEMSPICLLVFCWLLKIKHKAPPVQREKMKSKYEPRNAHWNYIVDLLLSPCQSALCLYPLNPQAKQGDSEEEGGGV